MQITRKCLAIVIVLCSFVAGICQEQDLRDRYGTRSLEAAQQIARAIELSKASKHKEALAAVDAALKADDRAQMAYYWRGNILSNLGEVPDSIEAYKKCLSSDLARSRRVSASAAEKLGVLLGKLNETDESSVYFTEAILADYDNAAGIKATSYRNLSINAERRGQHLSSALALTFAIQEKAKDVTKKRVLELFGKSQGQEVARVLHFAEKTPKLEQRPQPTQLSPVAINGDIPEPIAELWPEPQGGYLIAVPRDSRHYYVITTTPKIAVRKIPVASPIRCSCLVGGRLYAVAIDPARIDALVPDTGVVALTHPLKGQPPTSLTVFPGSGRAFFPAEGFLHELNLKTEAVKKTTVPADEVIGHPNRRFVFSYIKNERSRWLPCSLIKAVVTPNGLLTAELRENAAANGARMSVSPDGNWVAIAGGGGWRPTSNQADGGYGVAVFSASNFEHGQGFFATDAYPRGVCFNPVSAQVAVIREQDATVYHMADSKSKAPIKGPFNGAAAWSGDGRYLFLGGDKKGLLCWANVLNDKETQIAATWWKSIKIAEPKAIPVAPPTFAVVSAVQDFQFAEPSGEALSQALAQALAQGKTAKPPSWQQYTPYLKDDKLKRAIESVRQSLRNKDDFGITIYQVKTALKNYPDCAPLKFFLAEALRQGNRPDEAQNSYLDAVHGDAGRTDLSRQALNQLASLFAARGKDSAALHCLTTSLALDRANPQTLQLAQGLLKKQKLVKEADQVSKLMADLPRAPAQRTIELPRLAKPTTTKKPTAAELYRTSVASVVLVQAGDTSGSGVCIGSAAAILTNNHVVAASDSVDVYPFAYQGDTLVRLPKLTAKVILRSPRDDLAVLKLDAVSRGLRPLPVAEQSPLVGERIYSIGSPGMGSDVLEQSVSEGIISATNRVIEGSKYLQHTAAINPGNSGGPLIDEYGRLAGIVTLKAKLENVGFAVPVETVRRVFKSQ